MNENNPVVFNMDISLNDLFQFQTKYTLIDEQDIPLVESYSFEVRIQPPYCFYHIITPFHIPTLCFC